MTNREIVKNYIKNGGDYYYCSLQIGSGAGYDVKLAGKTWFSSATLEDTINAYRRYDMLPLYNCGMMDLADLSPDIYWEELERVESGSSRSWKNRLVTPKGSLELHTREDEFKGTFQTKYLITEEDELSILECYLDTLLENNDFSPVEKHVKRLRAVLGEDEPMNIQWCMHPYAILCFADICNNVIFASICPDVFKRLMNKVLRLNEKLIPEVKKGGADSVMIGVPGVEMLSPKYYEDFIVPYSKIVSEMAHKESLLIYAHFCSPIEPMLTLGYYNRMGIDLFETLSEAPVGNVKSMEDAFSKLSPEICTRGNIGLDALLLEEPDQIKERSFRILEAAKRHGRKHLLAASDYLFYETKEDNVIAMCEAVKEFNSLIC